MQKKIGDHTLRAKTTPLQASPGENVNSFEMGELGLKNVVEVVGVQTWCFQVFGLLFKEQK